MNKWQDPVKKNDGCLCSHNQGLFIPNRQLSFIVATFLLIIFAVFMTGYFLGKKIVVEQLTEKIQQEAFADHVYASVITQMPHDKQVLENSTLTCKEDSALEAETSLSTSCMKSEIEIVQENKGTEEDSLTAIDKELTHYYAQLIGFGTEKAAQLFVKKLATKGIETEIKKRASKTAKGRTSYWYQVVTLYYTNKDELSELVDRITKEEKIKDATIRVC